MRKLFWILIVILVVGSFAAYSFYKNLPSILSSTLTEDLKTKVEVKSISIGLNRIIVNGITISNPPGYHLKKALTIESIEIDSPLTNYFSSHIDINKIDVNNTHLYVEILNMSKANSNWSHILKSLNQDKPQAKKSNSKTQLTVKELDLDKIAITLSTKKGQKESVKPIKHIRLKNVGTDDGNISEKITKIIVNHLVRQMILTRSIKGITNIVIKTPEAIFENISKPFKFVLPDTSSKKP